jgi:predicted O-methyltransferase YrrM
MQIPSHSQPETDKSMANRFLSSVVSRLTLHEAALFRKSAALTHDILPDAVVASTLRRYKNQAGWATHLPEDASVIHTGTSQKARRFQEMFRQMHHSDGWVTSHVCIMQVIARLAPAHLPRRYLEIGVNEGYSVQALLSALHLQKAQHRQSLHEPFFDELVLADMWGALYGGTARGSHEHVENLIRSVHAVPEPIVFLDGDSRKTIPAYLRSRPEPAPFDVVYVDGDHSYEGAMADVENVLPFVGKVLLFDDIYHPAHCLRDRLLDLHRSLVQRLKSDFYAFTSRHDFGFTAFIRKQVFDALP